MSYIPTHKTDPRIPDHAVMTDGKFSLIPMATWNKYNEDQTPLICVHNCGATTQRSVFVSGPVDETCVFCGGIASEKIQTLFVLHNGHY